jgi:hypothetical protein
MKLSELRNVECIAHRRKHVMSEMIFVVLLSLLWSKEGFHVAPRKFDVISVIPVSVLMNEME